MCHMKNFLLTTFKDLRPNKIYKINMKKNGKMNTTPLFSNIWWNSARSWVWGVSCWYMYSRKIRWNENAINALKQKVLDMHTHWHVWNAKAEKIQDIENHIKATVLNQENTISNPRLLYITARNSIHMQDVVNTCVKNGNLHARIKRLMHRKYQYPKHKDHTKTQLIAPRYKITPNQIKSHQDKKA